MNIPFVRVVHLTLGFALLSVASANPTDSIVKRLLIRDFKGASKSIEDAISANDMPRGVDNIIKSLRSENVNDIHFGAIQKVLLRNLGQGLTDSSNLMYLKAVESRDLSVDAKLLTIRAMLRENQRMNSVNQSKNLDAFRSIIDGANSDAIIKAYLLRNIPKHLGFRDQEMLFKYSGSPDTIISFAAFSGLGKLIERNRLQKMDADNRGIFNRLSQIGNDPLSVHKVRAIAQIGEEYSQVFLAMHAGENVDFMEAALFHDPSIQNPVLIRKALKFLDDRNDSKRIMPAIRYGIKNPEVIIREYLRGDRDEIIAGMKIMQVFPAAISAFQQVIIQYSTHKDEQLMRAAMALLPYLPDQADQLQKIRSALKTKEEQQEFDINLTKSLLR